MSTPGELGQRVGDGARHRGDERAPAGGEDEVDLDAGAVDADVLDDAHVDDRDAAVSAAGVVDLLQRFEHGGAVCGHALLPGSTAMRKPVVLVARAGSACCVRRGSEPPAGVEVRAALDDAPAVGRAVRDPLPDVAGELLGLERARALRVRGDGDGPAHQRLGAVAARLVERVAPRVRAGVGAAGERLPLVGRGEARAVLRGERLGLRERHVGGGVVGELRRRRRAQVRVADRIAADQHPRRARPPAPPRARRACSGPQAARPGRRARAPVRDCGDLLHDGASSRARRGERRQADLPGPSRVGFEWRLAPSRCSCSPSRRRLHWRPRQALLATARSGGSGWSCDGPVIVESDSAGGEIRDVLGPSVHAGSGVFSPTGDRFAYHGHRGLEDRVFVAHLLGGRAGTQEELLGAGQHTGFRISDWSPDATRILYYYEDDLGRDDIPAQHLLNLVYTVPPFGSSPFPHLPRLHTVRGRELLPRQPDGRRLGQAAAAGQLVRLPPAREHRHRSLRPDRDGPQARRHRRHPARSRRLAGRLEDRLFARRPAGRLRRRRPRFARRHQRRRLRASRAHPRPPRHATAVVARRADAHVPAPDRAPARLPIQAAPVTTSTRSSSSEPTGAARPTSPTPPPTTSPPTGARRDRERRPRRRRSSRC